MNRVTQDSDHVQVSIRSAELGPEFSSSERSLLLKWIEHLQNYHMNAGEELELICMEGPDGCNCTKLKDDISNLITVIQRAYATKSWNCKDLKFHTITLREIFGQNFKVENRKEVQDTMTLEQMNESFQGLSDILTELGRRNKELMHTKVRQINLVQSLTKI